MVSVQEALRIVLAELPRLGSEQVSLTAARGRVLAEPVRARWDVPPFRNSAMDGYAVRAADVAEAAPGGGVRLRVLETIGAGACPTRAVASGEAVRIMTGAVVPDGADAVVRVEDTVAVADAVDVLAPVPPGANVRLPGEDVRAGEVILDRGRLLRPADVGVLASVGVSVVPVVRRPTVAIVTTGDELVDLGQPLGPGQIVNSNGYALAAAVEEAGGQPLLLGIVPDVPERMRAAFADACAADVLLSTGGVSAGSFDYVREILRDIGYEERFWKVAQKPGKPLAFGWCRGRPVFALPGNPVSSLVCFYVYVVPALRTMLGTGAPHLPTAEATLGETIRKANGLTEFVRVILSGPPHDLVARPTGTQSSGVLRSMSLGDGLVVGPPERATLEEGSRVRVLILSGNAPGLASAI